ncbi:uncharacterized protein G2W53_011110 [Senna tora]|uniref:Uncharacterized protein n=1 Tax=Senna tora TaxID=362788 RepID=A0A835CC40_9FABA|nr:uncharacterized protein G2W53_011110 [Senna tora]
MNLIYEPGKTRAERETVRTARWRVWEGRLPETSPPGSVGYREELLVVKGGGEAGGGGLRERKRGGRWNLFEP